MRERHVRLAPAPDISAHPGNFRKNVPAVIPRHRVSPSASPMTGSGGESSTPQPLGYNSGRWNTGSPAFAFAGDDDRMQGGPLGHPS
jgi:hypothetical protein